MIEYFLQWMVENATNSDLSVLIPKVKGVKLFCDSYKA